MVIRTTSTRWFRRLAALLAAMLLPLAAVAAAPVVAAASDLKFALEEIAQAFQRDTAQPVTLVFGSSGTFATQIRHGAPFQLFLSADEELVQQLHADGFTRDAGELYGIGRIVWLVPARSAARVERGLAALADDVRAGRIKRFAIANPEHAPYGRRAEEALRHAGLWEALRPALVLGENVSQAAQFATGWSADGGIVALSLALAPPLAPLGRYALIPAEWHAPLRQRMVLLKSADASALAFYRYLQQAPARAVMRRYGFVLPGEAP